MKIGRFYPEAGSQCPGVSLPRCLTETSRQLNSSCSFQT
jgi:hypothetical protein